MQKIILKLLPASWQRLMKLLRRSFRLARRTQKSRERGAAKWSRPTLFSGNYLLQGSRYKNGGIIISPAHTVLTEVFLDVLGEMGGQVVVVMGEDSRLSPPLLSISPPVAAEWLQNLLESYSDVLQQNHGIELSVQSVEKCCSAVLTPDKHIFVQACEPARYIRALESRGLREVEQIAAARHSARRTLASPMDEVRLDELKQYLSVTSATFSPRREWLH